MQNTDTTIIPTVHELKAKVKEFLEGDYDYLDYSSLPKMMFQSEYPVDGNALNSEGDKVVLARAKELNLAVHFEDNYVLEEQGRDYWSVYGFCDGWNIVYVKFDGWYASYHGPEYEDWFFVKHKQVQVTQFEPEEGYS